MRFKGRDGIVEVELCKVGHIPGKVCRECLVSSDPINDISLGDFLGEKVWPLLYAFGPESGELAIGFRSGDALSEQVGRLAPPGFLDMVESLFRVIVKVAKLNFRPV